MLKGQKNRGAFRVDPERAVKGAVAVGQLPDVRLPRAPDYRPSDDPSFVGATTPLGADEDDDEDPPELDPQPGEDGYEGPGSEFGVRDQDITEADPALPTLGEPVRSKFLAEALAADPSSLTLPEATPRRSTMPGGTFQMPMTRERVIIFLRELELTGSFAAAGRAASPHLKGGGSGAFHTLMKADPAFREAVEETLDRCKGRVEREIMRRAFTPQRRPVVSQGAVLGYEDRYDNTLLLKVARKLDPEAWGEKQQVQHTGSIAVRAGVMVVPGTLTEDEYEQKYGRPALPGKKKDDDTSDG